MSTIPYWHIIQFPSPWTYGVWGELVRSIAMALDKVALVLVIIGALNWLLVNNCKKAATVGCGVFKPMKPGLYGNLLFVFTEDVRICQSMAIQFIGHNVVVGLRILLQKCFQFSLGNCFTSKGFRGICIWKSGDEFNF